MTVRARVGGSTVAVAASHGWAVPHIRPRCRQSSDTTGMEQWVGALELSILTRCAVGRPLGEGDLDTT